MYFRGIACKNKSCGMVFRSNTETKKQAGDASKLYTGKYSKDLNLEN